MALTSPLNPTIPTGSNEAPDFAKQVNDRLTLDYIGLTNTLADLLEESTKLPEKVSSDADALLVGELIKRMRDLDRRVEAAREVEKEPYLRGGNAVDSWFNGMRDKIGKRNRNDRKAADGAADTLQGRINVFQEEKIAAERARRAAEAAAAEKAAREAAQKAAAEAAAAEAARLAAERARKPEAAAMKEAVAAQQEQAAAVAQIAADDAAAHADDAKMATYAKPSDIARVRGGSGGGGGVTLTVAQEPYATLLDRSKVDMEMLRPFFTDAEIEKALRGWARTTGHRVQMPGAAIGFRNRGVTR